jgi:hypothetical protein
MTDRKLFGTNTLIDDFILKLKRIDSSDNSWSAEYVEVETGRRWLEYVVDERGFSRNLMLISPRPTTEDLIEIVFSSNHLDEVSAAATRLCLEEQQDRREYRQMLFNRLSEYNLNQMLDSEKKRLKTIVQASELTDRVNKRNIIDKHYTESKAMHYFSVP